MQFRLHIDIPLGGDEQDAIEVTNHIMGIIKQSVDINDIEGLDMIQYRLGHDEDRQKSNYLVKTEEGHVTKKKCKIE